MTHFQKYISDLNSQFVTGITTEHSYRPALHALLSTVLPDMTVINEPTRISCGAPDYIITKRVDDCPVVFVEAKDLEDRDLDGRRANKEQFNRYKQALDRVIFTDYLDFHFYENGEWVENICIAKIGGDRINGDEVEFEKFVSLLKRFVNSVPQKITSAKKLVAIMAAKAKLLASTVLQILEGYEHDGSSEGIYQQYEAFKSVLINDLSFEKFADIYAQTVTYGMFAARLFDTTPEDFSREEAATLIPTNAPFLRNIFKDIAAFDLDRRLAWIIDDLVTTFASTDMSRILRGFGVTNRRSDPLIHFYESFLTAYNPKLRKDMGVWYTPAPVVKFMVKSVDEILQKEFSLPEGLADYSQFERNCINEDYSPRFRARGNRRSIARTFHKVQILDPAVGTGTFLAEVVNLIYDKFEGREGMWQGYVKQHLLSRLNGFEILMAPYAIAHLKLDWLLRETGYTFSIEDKLRVYLADSLEEPHEDAASILSSWLSSEAKEASRIKKEAPVMVVIGNPPYNGSSENKGRWIINLIESYKTEPGGEIPLNERNPKWINDDYVKFIRMAQSFIDKNGEGIIAFINPHGFLDNPTFRGMRWALLNSFDYIYTLDLHGSTKRGNKTPANERDENVFFIRQGVSINFFIKTGKKAEDELGKVYHADLYGLRKDKYKFLDDNSFLTVDYRELTPQPPMYYFVPRDIASEIESEYNMGFGIKEIFTTNSVGIVTAKDAFTVCFTREDLINNVSDLINLSEAELRAKYGLKDSSHWSIARAKSDVGGEIIDNKITKINFRWGDVRYLYYTGVTNGIVARPRYRVLRHLLANRNYALMTVRQLSGNNWRHVTVVNSISEACTVSTQSKEIGYVFPLYRISADEKDDETITLVSNLNQNIVGKIEEIVDNGALAPEAIFDYIYGRLHSPSYRERYNELLKLDFPKVPYPTDAEDFHYYAAAGRQLRELHTFEGSTRWHLTTTYPISGSNVIEKFKYDDGKVFINDTQYFGNVPREAWDLIIGGYCPAKKWLEERWKKRKGVPLSFEDIRHYQEIIHSLAKTIEILNTLR